MPGLIAPNLRQLEAYNVNVDGQPEVIYQPIYDFQTYAAAGFTSQRFFQVPAGQGGKTFDDTNMESSGALPVPVNMAITSIEVVFFPAAAIGVVGVTTIVGNNWNDVQAVHEAGHVSVVIGSKEYLLDAPLGRFPQTFRIAGGAAQANASTAAAAQFTQIDYAVFAGKCYEIVPLRLISQQNFRVDVVFDNGVVALPSTVDGRIGVRLNGFRYRLAQ